jgi:hypothetical protein
MPSMTVAATTATGPVTAPAIHALELEPPTELFIGKLVGGGPAVAVEIGLAV